LTDLVPQTLAAIDIGSNSIKLTVARRQGDGIEELYRDSETVRLGEGIEATGRLDDSRMDAARATLARFAGKANELGAERTMAVATEALRVAANGREFLERVVRETGIEAAVIDGDREAALTFAGLAPG
jgi:exopolyphosphatase/guanosine-5'-triphosphate,3'-diphosphate pyrophosphatase